jgi:hypothetical protein
MGSTKNMPRSMSKETLETRWIDAPLFPDRDDAKQSQFIVHNGVMKIQINDVDKRALIIPLGNVEYIDRVWLYLTFHMKSGVNHTIYVGNIDDSSPNDLARWIMSQFAVFTMTSSK